MRLFVALPVPEEVRDRLAFAVAKVRRDGDGLRWTRPEGWHVTLAFLGRVDDDRSKEVGEVVRSAVAGSSPVELSLTGAGRFSRRVLWCGVADSPAGAVARLGEEVQAAIEDAGLPVDRREVRPHLTLARAGKGQITSELEARVEVPPVSWDVDRVIVYQSILGRGPARYASVEEVALTG